MDDFEKWLEGHGRPRTNHNEDCLREAYEAGQAERERGECGCHLCRTAIGDGYGHDDSEQGTMVKALSARLAATTPVIEAAERILDESGFTEAVNSGDPPVSEFPPSYEQAIRALATYRAAVTKDDQKPSQEKE